MKYLKFLIVGTFFGIVLSKSEVISWYRIYEMFHFKSFHMYGVIGSAVVLGIISVQIIKRQKLKTIDGPVTREIIYRDWLVTGRAGGNGPVELVINDTGRIIFGTCKCEFFQEHLMNFLVI